MSEGPDMMFFIFIPCSVIYMVFIIIYITRESYKLRKKLIESGSLVSAVPILYINRPATPISPNGAPPPPPYSLTMARPPPYTTQIYSPQLEAYTPSDAVHLEMVQQPTNVARVASSTEQMPTIGEHKETTMQTTETRRNSTQTLPTGTN